MAFAGYGKPKFGGNSYAKTVKPKEGAAIVCRILPPMKSLAESGEWAVYHGVHYGYKGVNARDPNKPIFRTFKCIEEKDFKSKMIIQDCPECDLIAQFEAELETIKDNAKRDKLSAEDTKELTASHDDWLKAHNCDRKWHMNVKLQNGDFAVLNLSHKTKKNILDPLIAKLLAEEGINAIEPDQGVWFEITRTGKQIDAVDHITVKQEAVVVDGRRLTSTMLAPLTEAEAEKSLKECPDLALEVTMLTHQQIKMLTECSGEPEAVDQIFALGQKKKEGSPSSNSTSNTSSNSNPSRPVTQTRPSTPVNKTEEPAPKTETKTEAPSAGPSQADLLAMIAQLQAQLTGQKTVETTASAPKQEEPKVEAKAEEPAPTPEKVQPTPSVVTGAGQPPVDRAAFMAKFRSGKQA